MKSVFEFDRPAPVVGVHCERIFSSADGLERLVFLQYAVVASTPSLGHPWRVCFNAKAKLAEQSSRFRVSLRMETYRWMMLVLGLRARKSSSG